MGNCLQSLTAVFVEAVVTKGGVVTNSRETIQNIFSAFVPPGTGGWHRCVQ